MKTGFFVQKPNHPTYQTAPRRLPPVERLYVQQLSARTPFAVREHCGLATRHGQRNLHSIHSLWPGEGGIENKENS